MSTNITITSDDVSKSEAIGNFIAKALKDGGFADVKTTFPETAPIIEDGWKDSCWTAIKTAYPNFLNETVNVRAIKVEGLDVNGYDEEDEETAFQKQETAVRTKSGSQMMTSTFIYEDRPKKKSVQQLHQESAELRRQAMHIVSDKED